MMKKIALILIFVSVSPIICSEGELKDNMSRERPMAMCYRRSTQAVGSESEDAMDGCRKKYLNNEPIHYVCQEIGALLTADQQQLDEMNKACHMVDDAEESLHYAKLLRNWGTVPRYASYVIGMKKILDIATDRAHLDCSWLPLGGTVIGLEFVNVLLEESVSKAESRHAELLQGLENGLSEKREKLREEMKAKQRLLTILQGPLKSVLAPIITQYAQNYKRGGNHA